MVVDDQDRALHGLIVAAQAPFRHTGSRTTAADNRTPKTPGSRIGRGPSRRRFCALQSTDSRGGAMNCEHRQDQGHRSTRRSLERHAPQAAICGWLAFVVVALFDRQPDRPEDAHRRRLLRRRVGARRADARRRRAQAAGRETVLVQSRAGSKAGDPEFRAAVADVTRRVEPRHGRQERASPYAHGGAISKDRPLGAGRVRHPRRRGEGRGQGRPGDGAGRRPPSGRTPSCAIEQFGDASADKALSGVFDERPRRRPRRCRCRSRS